MKSIDEIRVQLAGGEFEFSQHAFKRAVERNISDAEICAAAADAVVIEDYPDDKYHQAACSWDSPQVDARFTFRYHTRRRSW